MKAQNNKRRIGGFARRAGISAVAVVIAASMCVPATALAYNGTPTGMNAYGLAPSEEIGNTAPKVGTDQLKSIPNKDADGKRYITAACGGSGTAIVDYADIVGLDNISSSNYNWGTNININPNSFAWNDILYTDESDVTCKSVQGDATSPSLGIGFVKQGPNGVMTYATVDKYRPDVLCNADLSSYQTIVSAINTADGNTSYSPQYAQISTNTLITQVDSLWAEAEAAENIMAADKNTTTRYEDPYQIAENFENEILGLQWYILSQHEQQGTLAKVVYLTGYENGTMTAATIDASSAGYSPGRTYEGFEQITVNAALDNPAWTASEVTSTGPWGTSTSIAYTSTDLSSLKDCDCVFVGFNGDNATALQEALDAIGYKGKVCVSPSLSVGNQGFGFSRNLLEYMGYLYPEDVNFAYTIKYWWSKFGHVKDEYIDAVMVATESTKLLPTGDAAADLDTTGYTEDYMNARFAAGISYYNQHKDDAKSYCSHARLSAQGSQQTGTVNHYQGKATYNLANAKSVNGTLVAEGVKLVEGVDYTLSGTTATGIGGYEGKATVTKPAAVAAKQTLSFASSVTKAKTLKAKSGKLAKTKTFSAKATGVKTAATYSLTYSNKAAKKYKKLIKINAKTGKITIKKGLKKGTYKIKVKASAKATSAYAAASKTSKVITIKVK